MKGWLRGGFTPTLQKEKDLSYTESISSMQYVEIGGTMQHVVIRGIQKNNPILLFLHGGPGGTSLGALRKYNSELERFFTVVYWEQRGTGKSFWKDLSPDDMTMEQFLSDLHELVLWVKEHLQQEKLFLAGHSWGSLLGILFANRYPEHLHAYIGINQVTDQIESEKRSYEYVLATAKKEKNEKAIKELKEIGPPRNGLYKNIKGTFTQRKLLGKFGGVSFQPNFYSKWLLSNLSSEEYGLPDSIKVLKGLHFSMKYAFPELMRYNTFTEVPALQIPAYFISGKRDRITCPELVEDYFQTLSAPHKEHFSLHHAGHLVSFEKAHDFHDIMIDHILSSYNEKTEKQD